MFNKKSLCCLVAAALFYGGCAQRTVFMPQKEFKEDTDYFIALRKARSGGGGAAFYAGGKIRFAVLRKSERARAYPNRECARPEEGLHESHCSLR